MVGTTTLIDAICARARELSPGEASEAELVVMAGDDRDALEAARDRVAYRLHGHAGDHAATAALTLLNRALVRYGWSERYDWKVRWAKHRKP
ncbi:MAG: hypothetical protein M3Y91_18575 [Actinomycetota bacterium]|nr:hypothetical protein [Actinomycetota bacterium]